MANIYSMTGFSTVQAKYNDSELTCEVRTLNSRYLEIMVKLPRLVADLENPIKDVIRKKITRGKVMYSLSFSALTGELQNLKIDPATVQIYTNLLKQIRQAAGLEVPITLDHLLSFKDIISFEEENEVDEELVETIYRLTEKTLDDLNRMRAREGENLKTDLQNRLSKIELLINEIASLGKENPRIEFERLYNRLLLLIEEEKLDLSRVEQELALITDKVDISEETVRMKSHLQLFKDNLNSGSPIGKKLNFILQEMHREVNTMSNKATMIEISHRVVTIKEEIEKIREQVQNIE